MVAEREAPVVLAGAEKTIALIEAEVASQFASLTGAIGQDVVTPSVLLPPAAGRVAVVVFSTYEHALAGWVTATSWLETVMIAVCVSPVVFATAFSVMVPLPVPLALVNVSHVEPPSSAVHPQPSWVVTCIETLPPL